MPIPHYPEPRRLPVHPEGFAGEADSVEPAKPSFGSGAGSASDQVEVGFDQFQDGNRWART
jgi:hypothetical protein